MFVHHRLSDFVIGVIQFRLEQDCPRHITRNVLEENLSTPPQAAAFSEIRQTSVRYILQAESSPLSGTSQRFDPAALHV